MSALNSLREVVDDLPTLSDISFISDVTVVSELQHTATLSPTEISRDQCFDYGCDSPNKHVRFNPAIAVAAPVNLNLKNIRSDIRIAGSNYNGDSIFSNLLLSSYDQSLPYNLLDATVTSESSSLVTTPSQFSSTYENKDNAFSDLFLHPNNLDCENVEERGKQSKLFSDSLGCSGDGKHVLAVNNSKPPLVGSVKLKDFYEENEDCKYSTNVPQGNIPIQIARPDIDETRDQKISGTLPTQPQPLSSRLLERQIKDHYSWQNKNSGDKKLEFWQKAQATLQVDPVMQRALDETAATNAVNIYPNEVLHEGLVNLSVDDCEVIKQLSDKRALVRRQAEKVARQAVKKDSLNPPDVMEFFQPDFVTDEAFVGRSADKKLLKNEPTVLLMPKLRGVSSTSYANMKRSLSTLVQ